MFDPAREPFSLKVGCPVAEPDQPAFAARLRAGITSAWAPHLARLTIAEALTAWNRAYPLSLSRANPAASFG